MKKVRILSRSSEPFRNRIEAGRLLAEAIRSETPERPVIVGVPRGGMVVAAELAAALAGELDVVIVRKLGAPGNPELAIGAMTENGTPFIDTALAQATGVSESYLTQEKSAALKEIARRSAAYRTVCRKTPLKDRAVIITDDGVATGYTLQAAIWAVRLEQPRHLIVALPVGPPETLERLADFADRVVCLRCPSFFQAVGQFYEHFDQTDDAVVLDILSRQVAHKRT